MDMYIMPKELTNFLIQISEVNFYPKHMPSIKVIHINRSYQIMLF